MSSNKIPQSRLDLKTASADAAGIIKIDNDTVSISTEGVISVNSDSLAEDFVTLNSEQTISANKYLQHSSSDNTGCMLSFNPGAIASYTDYYGSDMDSLSCFYTGEALSSLTAPSTTTDVVAYNALHIDSPQTIVTSDALFVRGGVDGIHDVEFYLTPEGNNAFNDNQYGYGGMKTSIYLASLDKTYSWQFHPVWDSSNTYTGVNMDFVNVSLYRDGNAMLDTDNISIEEISSLETTSKTVVGAINELKSGASASVIFRDWSDS